MILYFSKGVSDVLVVWAGSLLDVGLGMTTNAVGAKPSKALIYLSKEVPLLQKLVISSWGCRLQYIFAKSISSAIENNNRMIDLFKSKILIHLYYDSLTIILIIAD